ASLYLAALLFIAASLGLGLLISTMAKTQFQAMQLTIFTFLPSILLSGFMFPFDGMPAFARGLGEFLPLTHFIRLVRGVLLRGAELSGMWVDIWPLLAFFALTMFLAVLKFHKRLD
ncbi:MAG TPA: ABC transporter permease, partial [Gammaproteobacteria bacterium]